MAKKKAAAKKAAPKKAAAKKAAKKVTVQGTDPLTKYELPPVVEYTKIENGVYEIPERKDANKKQDFVSVQEILDHLRKSTEVMKTIRSQFGYSGYSNPNYVNLDRKIQENEKFLEGL